MTGGKCGTTRRAVTIARQLNPQVHILVRTRYVAEVEAGDVAILVGDWAQITRAFALLETEERKTTEGFKPTDVSKAADHV